MSQDIIPILEESGDAEQPTGGVESAATSNDSDPAIVQNQGRRDERPIRYLRGLIIAAARIKGWRQLPLPLPWDDLDEACSEVYRLCLASAAISSAMGVGASEAMEAALSAVSTHTPEARRVRDEMARLASNFVERALYKPTHNGGEPRVEVSIDRRGEQPPAKGLDLHEWDREMRELLECLQGREDLRAIAEDLLRDYSKDEVAVQRGVSVRTIERRIEELREILIKVLGRPRYRGGRNPGPSP